MVALQAIALYSATLYSIPVLSSKGSSKTPGQSSQSGSSKVVVNCPNSQLTFHVNRNNRLLYQQEMMLKDVAGKYTVEMKGTATVSVQVSASTLYAQIYIHLLKKIAHITYSYYKLLNM